MPTDYEQLLRQSGKTPSPGGLDLNSLLQRGISGTIAGAQEETGIKRRQAAGDLLSQQLAQAAQELESRMKGYEFNQTQRFDDALLNDPRLQATLLDAFERSGGKKLSAPTSRLALGAYHQFDQSTQGYNDIAASILKNWQVAQANSYFPHPEPAEVAWARNVLRVPGATSGAGTNAPAAAAPAATSRQDQVPYGLGRAAAAGGVQGLGYAAGSKGLISAVGKLAPKLASKLPGWAGPVAGIVTAGLAGTGYNQLVDPRALEAELEHPYAAGLSTVGTATSANLLRRRMMMAREAGATGSQSALGSLLQEKVGSLRPGVERGVAGGPEFIPGLSTAASGVARAGVGGGPEFIPRPIPQPLVPYNPGFTRGGVSTGGPQPMDFVRRFKTFYGRNPTQQEFEQAMKGFTATAPRPGQKLLNAPPAPTPSMGNVQQFPGQTSRVPPQPYKPKVKGYEEFLQKQFGE